MRKTLGILILVLLSTMGFSQSNGTNLNCADLVQKTVPPNAVNDFANILNNEDKAVLEQKLRAYWDSTSISIVVTTVYSLNDNDVSEYSTALFNCWGVGDKTNRGVLMLVAPNERKVYLSTGQGIEFILYDGLCKRVIEEDIIPSFKNGDYPLGILNGVNSLINILGTMSWEDRMAAIEERAKIEKIAEQKTKENIESAITMVVIIALFVGVVYFIVSLIFRIKKKILLKKNISNLNSEVSNAKEMIEMLRKNYLEQAPKWAQQEMEDHLTLSEENINSISDLIAESVIFLKKTSTKNVGGAEENIRNAKILLDKAFLSFEKVDTKLREKVIKFSSEVKDVWNNALTVSSERYQSVKSYIGKGYEFEPELLKIERILKRLESLQADINNPENHKNVHETSTDLKNKAVEIEANLAEIIKDKKKVDKALPGVDFQLKEAKGKIDQYSEKLNSFRKKYDRSAWGKLEEDLNNYSRKMNGDLERRIDKMKDVKLNISSINLLNQNFLSLVGVVEGVRSVFSAIDSFVPEQEKAKADFFKKIPDAEKAIAEALKEIKDSDVGENAKKEAKKAVQSLKTIKAEAEDGVADWVSLLVAIVLCIQFAKKATEMALNDVSEAAQRRARRRREKEERERSSYSPSFSTYSSGSFSGGGGGSSFGGFGGGFSGGGGAGGSW